MCQVCREVRELWPLNDDHGLSEVEFDELLAAAERVTLSPGPHTVGVGVTGRMWVDGEARDAQ